MFWPRAEDANFYYTMGMDLDLDVAMRNATQETVRYLMETRGLSAADAYSLASIAIDFRDRRGGRCRAGGVRRDPEADLPDQPGLLVQALMRRIAACLLALCLAAAPAAADTIRIVIPYAPGGALDPLARILANGLGKVRPGDAIVVENIGGAGGIVGMSTVAKAPPDGRTLPVQPVRQHRHQPVAADRRPTTSPRRSSRSRSSVRSRAR